MSKQSIAKFVPVLLTRPELQSRAFAGALVKRFGQTVRPLVAPLMAPRFLSPEVPKGDFTAAIFTSVWGVASVTQLGAHLPRQAYCVGRKTAAVAEVAGFDVRSSDGNADALVASIIADQPVGRLLHFRGVDGTGEIGKRLNSAGIETETVLVYQQEPQAFSAEAADLLRASGDVILPLFSPRSAALFTTAMPPDTLATLHIAAMSAEVAEAAAALPHATLVVARQPDAVGMLEAVERLLATASAP